MNDESIDHSLSDPFEELRGLPELRTRTFKTPSAGLSARPFRVIGLDLEGLELKTSRGGRVRVRQDALYTALKALGDLGSVEPEGWVRINDATLQAVLQSEGRGQGYASYVLPLLEATGRVELRRERPAFARLARPGG